MNSCLIIAGEKSGEEHAMTFFPELKKLCPETDFFGVGGEDLSLNGVELLYHLKDFSSMGFSEVIQKIPFYFKAMKRLENEVIKRGTKTAILIDFQDFNLRLAQRLSKLGVQVLYYVAPQAWVWKPKRAAVLAKTVHTLYTILPFEKKWFHDRGVKQVRGIPHPLMRTYAHEFKTIPEKPFSNVKNGLELLLLPGSRKFEVQLLLEKFITAKKMLEKKGLKVRTHLVKVKHLPSYLYDYFADDIDVWYESEELVKAMNATHMSLAASGTVTLSTGLFELPTVVAYRGSLLNEYIYNNFINYQGPVSLTNIIHGEMVFPELLQDQARPELMAREIYSWVTQETEYNRLKGQLKKTKELLSGENFSVPESMAQVINK